MSKFFNDLTILMGSHSPSCQASIDKHFDYYVINYAQSGTLRLQVGDETYTLIAPVVWLAYPGVRLRFCTKNTTESWDHRYVAFSGKRVRGYIECGWLPVQETPAMFPIATPERFRMQFDKVLLHIQSGTQHTDVAAHALEGLLLSFVKSRTTGENRIRWTPAITALSEAIRKTPQQAWYFAEESRHLSMSLTHFRRVFKQVVGEAPQQFLLRSRMNFAARLLAKELPVKEAARQCGIADVYYFSRLFKKFMHIPPARYQREARW